MVCFNCAVVVIIYYVIYICDFQDGLFALRPKAAGFSFLVQLHVTSWGSTSRSSRFKIGRYQNRTRTMTDRMKHVTKPERLQPGGLSTHLFIPRWDSDYHRYMCMHSFLYFTYIYMKSGSSRLTEHYVTVPMSLLTPWYYIDWPLLKFGKFHRQFHGYQDFI